MSEILSDSVLMRRPDVRYRDVGDEGIIVSQDQGEVVAVNQVGARLLSLIDGNRSFAQIMELMRREFDVSEETLTADSRAYVGELVSTGVLEIAER